MFSIKDIQIFYLVVLCVCPGDSLDLSGIINDPNLGKSMEMFANTKAGRAYLSKFAAKGQELFGHVFESDGEYHSAGVNISFNAAELGEGFGSNGTTLVKVTDSGLDITVKINTQLNWKNDNPEVERYFNAGAPNDGSYVQTQYQIARAGTIIHETTLHAEKNTQVWLNRGKINDWEAILKDKNSGYYHHIEAKAKGNFLRMPFGKTGLDAFTEIYYMYNSPRESSINDKAIRQRLKEKMLNFVD